MACEPCANGYLEQCRDGKGRNKGRKSGDWRNPAFKIGLEGRHWGL